MKLSCKFTCLLARYVVFGVSLFICALNPTAVALEKIKFLTWEDYISPEIVTGFEKKYDVEIEFVFFEHDEQRDDLLAVSESGIYDVFIVDGQSVDSYKRLDWLAPLTEKEIPEIANYDSQWREIRPSAEGYTVPYGWGTFGITYRKDLVKTPITSLMDVFRPEQVLKGKIIMSPQAFELVPSAILALGYPMANDDPKALIEAEQMLQQQKPFVYSYEALELDENSPLITGAVIAAQAYNSDALTLADINDDIGYVVPKEGSPVWIDFLAVSSKSNNKELAYKFIRYLSETDIVRQNMEYTYTANFHSAAIKLLPKELKNNTTVFYPNIDELFILERPKRNTIRKIMNIIQNLDIDEH